MKRKTRIASVVAVLVAVVGITTVAAGGAQESTGAGTAAEPIDVKMMIRDRSSIVWDGSPLQQEVADRFGINISCEVIDYSAYSEKFQIVFNTGKLPDIANGQGIDTGTINEAGDRGVLLNIFDYLGVMPELKTHLIEHETDLPFLVSENKGLYLTPLVFDMTYQATGICVRKDVLDARGFDLSAVETYDDLYRMLKVLHDANGGKPVISARYGIWTTYALGEFMGVGAGPMTWDFDKQQWEGSYYRPGFEDWLRFFAKIYEEGILHPDFLTMQTKERDELLYNGEQLAFVDSMAYLDHAQNNQVSGDQVWTHVLPPKYKGRKYPHWGYAKLTRGQSKIVSAKTKAPEQIMRFLDWTYGDEGMLRTQRGIEGVDYTFIEPGKWIVLNQQYQDNYPSEYHDMLMPDEEYRKRMDELPFDIYGLYAITTPWRVFARERQPLEPTLFEEGVSDYVDNGYYTGPKPATPFTDEQQDILDEIGEPIHTYAEETITKMVLGQLDIGATLPGFYERLEELRYQTMIDIYNESYEAFKSRSVSVD
jgi:putative aldouronate transport system substrate-binding protein